MGPTLDDRDRDDFVRRVAALATAGKVLVYAWALVPNHVHLLVCTASLSLARVMHSLLTGYAGAFNRRHRAPFPQKLPALGR